MDRTGTPIVFFCRGNPVGLKYAVQQARWASPECPVYLLADETTDDIHTDGRFRIQDYLTDTQSFIEVTFDEEKAAATMAPHSLDLDRWLLLRALARRQGWDSLWCLDPEVLLFDSLHQETATLTGADLAFCFDGPPACVFATAEGLEHFCGFLLDLFSDRAQDLRDSLEQAAAAAPGQNPETVAGRLVFGMYLNETPLAAEDLGAPRGGAVFDRALSEEQGFAMDPAGRHKKIVWTNRTPYFVSTDTKLVCRAKALHLDANSQASVLSFYTAPPLQVRLAWDRGLAWAGGLLGKGKTGQAR